MKSIKLKKGEALMLRTCKRDGSSSHGFVWPKKGPVKCEDWKPTKTCGNGLHGLLWGQGDGSLLDWDVDAAWLVVRITEHVDLGGKIKIPAGVVEYFGTRLDATALIAAYAPLGTLIAGGTASAGHHGTASAGYYGTASAGHYGTASAGHYGTASAGHYGTASAGYYGTASAGYYGTASAGEGGTASAGDYGMASAGDYGMASAGDRGTASAGDYGMASAGDRGTASAGYYGTASAGYGGCISIPYWNGQKYKMAVFAVGEDGIKPGVKYSVNNTGDLVEMEN